MNRRVSLSSTRSLYFQELTLDQVQQLLMQHIPLQLRFREDLQYTENDMMMAGTILNHFNVDVSTEIRTIIKSIYHTVFPDMFNIATRSNALANRKKHLQIWLADVYKEYDRKGKKIISNRSGQNVTADTFILLINYIIGQIHKTLSTIEIWGGRYTQKQREHLIVYQGLYDAIFLSMIHFFFLGKLMVRQTTPTPNRHSYLMEELYQTIRLPSLPEENGLQTEGLPTLESLRTEALRQSLQNAPTRGGRRRRRK